MANRLKFTTQRKDRFLAELRRTCNVTHSARFVDMSARGVYDARNADPEFAAAWDDAVEEGVDILELEARRRALDGCEVPVYQGGVLVGTKREFSDLLTIFLLKAHRPSKYRERASVEHSGPDGGPIAMYQSASPDELRDLAIRIVGFSNAAPAKNGG